MSNPLNIAHRGGAQLWPENTLPAFMSAAREGFDAAELDVQLTRDDRLVVFHDFRLKPALCRNPRGEWLRRRHFGLPPAIHDLSFAELREYDVGRANPASLYARRHRRVTPFDGARMPSLVDVIRAIRNIRPEFRLFIEIKTALTAGISAPPEAVAEAVLDELVATDFVDNAVLVGFAWAGLIEAKKRNGKVQCWFNTEPRSRLSAHQIAAAGGDGWFCPLNRANSRTLHSARISGLRFGVWTVNRVRDMKRLIEAGVDGICTDRPDRLRHLLSGEPVHRPSNNAVER